MESSNRRSRMPWVPAEIWRHIILQLDLPSMSYSELALVWTDLRGVSKFFHTEVEALFERSVLLGTTVDFYWLNRTETDLKDYARMHFGATFTDLLDIPTGIKQLGRRNFAFSFSRICEGSGLAVFKLCQSPLCCRTSYQIKQQADPHTQAFFERLELLSHDQSEHEIAHSYILQVSEGYNDVLIPAMCIQKNEEEISFDWKELFSKLFAEEKSAIKLAKQSKAITKGILREERLLQYNVDGDFRSYLRSRRFKDWYNRQCRYIALSIPDFAVLNRVKIEERILEHALQDYHDRFRYKRTRSALHRLSLKDLQKWETNKTRDPEDSTDESEEDSDETDESDEEEDREDIDDSGEEEASEAQRKGNDEARDEPVNDETKVREKSE